MELFGDQDAPESAAKPNATRAKRNFSGLSLRDAMGYVGQTDFVDWQIDVAPRPPSAFLTEALTRFDAFSLTNSEAAKLLLIDILFRNPAAVSTLAGMERRTT